MPTGALIAGGLGAIGNVAGGLISSNAAQTAAQQQEAAIQQAIAAVQQIYGQGRNQIGNLFQTGYNAIAPVISQGQGIVSSISPFINSLLQGGPNALKTLSSTPGFQFSNYWGQNAVSNQATASGLGGNALAAGANYAEGLAGNTFSSVLGAANNFANTGVNLAGTATGALGSLTGSTIGTTGSLTSNLAGSISGLTTGLGQAQAQGTLGSANALASSIQGAGSSVGNAYLLSQLPSLLAAKNASSAAAATATG